MVGSSVLTSAQEIEIGRAIGEAELAVLEALASSPSGARGLAALADAIANARIDPRALLLNPDQDGLDIAEVVDRVRESLELASSTDEAARTRAVETLAGVRLDNDIVEGLVRGLRDAAGSTAAVDPSDELALVAIERAQGELRRSKERLVLGNLRLVVLFARKYVGRGVALLDLVQEGNLGLIRAADKFDHRRGFRFSTYAAWWIKQALQRALLDRAVRLPVHVADDRRRIGKIRAAYSAQHRREPTAEEISAASGLHRERVETILALPPQPSSLDAPVGEEGDARLVDLVPGSVALPDDAAAQAALSGHLRDLFDVLSPRERKVLEMRFGIGHPREHTLEEVGRELSLTRERVRQIERAALEKLRPRSERAELHSYLEG